MSTVSITDNEKTDFLQELVRALRDPPTVVSFVDIIKELGVRAVKIDEGFAWFSNTLNKFAEEQGDKFPDFKKFQTEWRALNESWMTLINMSQHVALRSAVAYQEYETLLQMVTDLETKEDLKDLADELKKFARNNTADIPPDFEKRLLGLAQSVGAFQARLNECFDKERVDLPGEVEKLINEIDGVMEEIQALTKQINDITVSIGLAPWWGVFATIIPGSIVPLAVLVTKRADKQRQIEILREELKEQSSKHPAPASLRAQLAALAPGFQLFAKDLFFIPEIWNGCHNEALEFAYIFEKLDKPSSIPKIIRVRIELARAVSAPLAHALRGYAMSVNFLSR